MPARAVAADAAYQAATRLRIDEIVGFLQDTLGQRLVAHLAGVTDPKAVGRWARGEREPRAEADQRLRLAYQVFHLLQSRESQHTVRAWFVGLNPQLDDEAPAEAIRAGRLRDVWAAAKSYVSGG
jgi:hypothetical protein